ncbi:hypothetical protein ACHAXH_006843 [Discostella pseudostelligera]
MKRSHPIVLAVLSVFVHLGQGVDTSLPAGFAGTNKGIDPGFSSVNYPYTKIFQNNVTGEGKGNVTELPDLTTPVIIPAGSTYSFYITVASLSFGTNIWYNIGVAVGDIVASDELISIGEGYALGYPFVGYTPKRRWNGGCKIRLLPLF